jgi:predicted nucleic acid-binding protein
VIVVDTSGLLAAMDTREPAHARAARALSSEPGPFVLSPFVFAEVDYLLLKRIGREQQRAFLREVAHGAYLLAPLGDADTARLEKVILQYDDADLGVADASLVVLCDRYGTDTILTLDERHFRALRQDNGKPFKLLPSDAPN